jgi:hypothetical protein
MEIAKRWINHLLPLQVHLLKLVLPRSTSRARATDKQVIALDEYEFDIICPEGNVMEYQLWYIVERKLNLVVTQISQKSIGSGGSIDPTKWTIAVRTQGCPEILKAKTNIKLGDLRLWIHHTAFLFIHRARTARRIRIRGINAKVGKQPSKGCCDWKGRFPR